MGRYLSAEDDLPVSRWELAFLALWWLAILLFGLLLLAIGTALSRAPWSPQMPAKPAPVRCQRSVPCRACKGEVACLEPAGHAWQCRGHCLPWVLAGFPEPVRAERSGQLMLGAPK